MSPIWRHLRAALAVILLLALSVSGFWGVDQQWKHAADLPTRFAVAVQVGYAVLGILAVPVLFLRLRALRPLLYAWAFCLLLTGTTAPVIWGGGGWVAGFFTACVMAVISGMVIWLAPLPQASDRFRRVRWLLVGLFAVAAVIVLSAVVKVAPAVIHSRSMEEFCRGLPNGLDQKTLTAMAQQQGYVATSGRDASGLFLKITRDDAGGALSYSCQARFKAGGKLDSISFTAGATVK